MDLSSFALGTVHWQTWGGVLVLVLVGIATKSESRCLWAAIAANVVAPSPASFYVIALLALVWKFFSAINVGRG